VHHILSYLVLDNDREVMPYQQPSIREIKTNPER